MAGSGTAHLRDRDDLVLRVEHLVKTYRDRRGAGTVHAVSDVSFDIAKGETLGLVGESGCGKSTAGRAILQLPPPTSGRVVFQGQDLTELSSRELRRMRPQLRMVFQDPISSLNPRRKVGDVVAEPLTIWGDQSDEDRLEAVRATLRDVGLDPATTMDRHPHQFSGGQCQRISLARALMLDPALIICDEPVSALDVSVQAAILNLLEDLKAKYHLTLLFIAHDLAVVKNISDRVAVMYLGKLCELAPSDRLYESPAHPYTRVLLSAIPDPDPASRQRARITVSGELPSATDPPSGCRFRTRCPRAEPVCAEEEPLMRPMGPDQYVACHFPHDDPWNARADVDGGSR